MRVTYGRERGETPRRATAGYKSRTGYNEGWTKVATSPLLLT
jgi:hypothetical protein